MLPARRNKVYKIKVDLWSLAMVFPKGHRISVQVTSSDVPRFDRHTNTWDPVHSYEEAIKATNTVHHSASHPSRLVLPVIKPAR
jgi:putative CocE/NonD family hydrolase